MLGAFGGVTVVASILAFRRISWFPILAWAVFAIVAIVAHFGGVA